MRRAVYGALSLGAVMLVAACSQQTLNSAQHDAQHDATVVQRDARMAAKAAKPQIKKAALGARVTAALEAANLHGIRVDADEGGVTLQGHVASQEEKTRVIRIAHDTLGPGKVIRSRLVINGHS